jgi:hypothetical protein
VISVRAMGRKERATMNKRLNPPPRFRSRAKERRFWESRDSTDYVDGSKATRVSLANLKMSTTAISLSRPRGFFDRIKVAANKQDEPNESLIKVWPAQRVDAE